MSTFGTSGPSEGSHLSKLAETILESCAEALRSSGDLDSDQVERMLAIAKGAKKPKPSDLEVILAEEGPLT